MRSLRPRPASLWALLAGLTIAASIPPWGFWPLAFVGLAVLDRLIADQPAAVRFRRGTVAGIGLLGPTMWWIHDLTLPGFVVAALSYSLIMGLGLVAVPPGRGRYLALPAMWVLLEAFRSSWPFGGVPLSLLAAGQVAGPLAGIARVGGVLLIGAVTVAIGVALSALSQRRWASAGVAVAFAAVVLAVSAVAPSGDDTGRTITAAYVQGGGPQGTHAIDTDPTEVYERHLAVSRQVPEGIDLTLWPEDVVDLEATVAETDEGEELADLAREKGTHLVIGVVEDAGETNFRNASVVFDPEGEVIARYDKVHRVPFGEFVPFRSLIERVAPETLPKRDAIAGEDPNLMETPVGDLATVISWEVFFGHRARVGVRAGGELVLNPTNGASFTGTLVQTQQIAASRLRAIETGRWVVQAAPTGFSAFITPEGEVIDRTGQREGAWSQHDVALRSGQTYYVRYGDGPLHLTGLLVVLAAWALAHADRRRRSTAAGREAPDDDVAAEPVTV